jgi:hypothetical protein
MYPNCTERKRAKTNLLSAGQFPHPESECTPSVPLNKPAYRPTTTTRLRGSYAASARRPACPAPATSALSLASRSRGPGTGAEVSLSYYYSSARSSFRRILTYSSPIFLVVSPLSGAESGNTDALVGTLAGCRRRTTALLGRCASRCAHQRARAASSRSSVPAGAASEARFVAGVPIGCSSTCLAYSRYGSSIAAVSVGSREPSVLLPGGIRPGTAARSWCSGTLNRPGRGDEPQPGR